MDKAKLNIDLTGLDLLVVEDDATSAFLISRSLSKNGARVETAVNGIAGLQKFQEQHFPVVITDINMPGMNGLELVNRIKTLDPDVQIIATSANRETDCLVAAIGLGFNEYLLKPVDIDTLLVAVKRCNDIIEVKKQLESEREKFSTVVECLGEGITIKDLDYKIIYQNRAMTEQFGDHTGSPCYKMFGLDEPCPSCPTIKTMKDGHAHTSSREYRVNDTTLYIESTASLLRDSRGIVTGTFEIIRDISRHIKNERTIREMAFHDSLTGLANRRLFEDRLEQSIAKSRRYVKKFGLLYLDLDHFKHINDTLGHEVGDLVLIEAGKRIKSCCKRDIDTISRHGGDEFCIIFNDCGGSESLTVIATELLHEFAQPFQIGNAMVDVTISIGISIFPDDGVEMKALEVAADRAMYAAKEAGRNTYRFWGQGVSINAAV